MRIEVATVEHVDTWVQMRAALWPDAPLDEHLHEIADNLASSRHERIGLIAFSDREVVAGFAEVSIRHDPVNGCDTSPVAFLEGLYVKPLHRRGGIARLLLAAVEAWGRSAGLTELGSDSDCENVMGLAFHMAEGFAETERVVFFKKDL